MNDQVHGVGRVIVHAQGGMLVLTIRGLGSACFNPVGDIGRELMETLPQGPQPIVADECLAIGAVQPTPEQVRYMVELLRAAKCPEPRCSDGSIISTGPDPQNDACEWCYQRHVTIEAFSQCPNAGTIQEKT